MTIEKAAGAIADATPTWLSRSLNLLGVIVVAYYLALDFLHSVPVLVAVPAAASLLAWAAAAVLPGRYRAPLSVLLGTMVVGGSIAAVPTNGLAIVPATVAVLRLFAEPRRPIWHGAVGGLTAAACLAVAALVFPIPLLGLVAMEGGVLVAALAGISRRQFRTAEAQSRALLEERVAIQEEQAHGAALAERQRVAREIHDVLAHSLGGLVIQLDAVEALLEAGEAGAAFTRVRDARALAASGLSEARRAVDALRDDRPGEAVDGASIVRDLGDLAEAHRALGGRIDFTSSGAERPLPADEAQALVRAMQESLTNARKHAPGQPVAATLEWTPDSVSLVVSNPMVRPVDRGSADPQPGGHHGLEGMIERFDAVRSGSVTAGECDGDFVVRALVLRS
ncbi:sensor histidine kinase [Lacisediminihabitans profunda]|uniref:histidine kinase n=1 Tax=Lacisediminihabitans profunda TaxID=2594790 RepID=A0A5C8UMQ5_9MICO|nr:histidine kinase [Lacisediminihabitans profunda]TXN29692.1 two-component sensor histidine kinase [Lacisediminihabitans profunda]